MAANGWRSTGLTSWFPRRVPARLCCSCRASFGSVTPSGRMCTRRRSNASRARLEASAVNPIDAGDWSEGDARSKTLRQREKAVGIRQAVAETALADPSSPDAPRARASRLAAFPRRLAHAKRRSRKSASGGGDRVGAQARTVRRSRDGAQRSENSKLSSSASLATSTRTLPPPSSLPKRSSSTNAALIFSSIKRPIGRAPNFSS